MNQPAFLLIRQPGNKSFVYKSGPLCLHTRWHYHPELELVFFQKGNNSAIIGNVFRESGFKCGWFYYKGLIDGGNRGHQEQ